MVDYTEGSGRQYHTGVGPQDIGKYVIQTMCKDCGIFNGCKTGGR